MKEDLINMIQSYIDRMQSEGKQPSTEDLNRYISSLMQQQNSAANSEFEGYSPEEMHWILNFTFEEKSPVQFKTLPSDEYLEIPIFRQVKFLIDTIVKENGLKLTAKGNLPVRTVKEMYALGVPDHFITVGIGPLYKEADSLTVHLAKILTETSGVAKNRKGILSLTAKGKKIVSSNAGLFKSLFETFCLKFNWQYFDNYESAEIGKVGLGFSLILIQKYGHEQKSDQFYAQKYFNAFPDLSSNAPLSLPYETVNQYEARCYSLRTFARFLHLFGLVDIEDKHDFTSVIQIQKSSLFDRLIEIRPHRRSM